ncbi:MAG: primosomal replication protein PriC [Arsenophonus sp. ET-DL12-MAG3]
MLNLLEEEIETIAQQIEPIVYSSFITLRFDKKLFNRKSHQLSECLFEIKQHFSQLKNAVIKLHSEQVIFFEKKLFLKLRV